MYCGNSAWFLKIAVFVLVRLSPVTTVIEAYDVASSSFLSSFSLPDKFSFFAFGLGSKYK